MTADWRPGFLDELGDLCRRYAVDMDSDWEDSGVFVRRDGDTREIHHLFGNDEGAWGTFEERRPKNTKPLPMQDPTLTKSQRLRAEIARLEALEQPGPWPAPQPKGSR